jgi:hypothetical protein
MPAEVGLYCGPGNTDGILAFERWLGAPVTRAHDYVGYAKGWYEFDVERNIAHWLLGPFGEWRAAGPGRRFLLGVPLLVSGYEGEFGAGEGGSFDGYFRGLAEGLVHNGLADTVIDLGYEYNNPGIGPWSAVHDPGGYRAMFRRVVSVMREAAGQRFTFAWTSAMGESGGIGSFSSGYPGDDVVDLIGINVYDVSWGERLGDAERWEKCFTRTMGIADCRDFAAARGKPLVFPEWGLYGTGDVYCGGGDNPLFIDRMADLFEATRPDLQAYFDLDWGGRPTVLDNFPDGKARYRERFGG